MTANAGFQLDGFLTLDELEAAAAVNHTVFGDFELAPLSLFDFTNVTDHSRFGINSVLSGNGMFRVNNGDFQNAEAAINMTATANFFGELNVLDTNFLGMNSALTVNANANATAVFNGNIFNNVDIAGRFTQAQAAAGFNWTLNGNLVDGGGVGNDAFIFDVNSATNLDLINNRLERLLRDGITVNGAGSGTAFTANLTGNVVQDMRNGFNMDLGGNINYELFSTGNSLLNASGDGWIISGGLNAGFGLDVIDNGSSIDGSGGAGIRFENRTGNSALFLEATGTQSINNGESGAIMGGWKLNFSLHDVDFSNNGGAGLIVDTDSDIHIEGSTVNNNGNNGIQVNGNGIVDVDNTQITNNTGDGVEVRSAAIADVAGSTITGNSGYGVEVQSGGTATLINNTVSGNTLGQIFFEDPTNLAINMSVTVDTFDGTFSGDNAVDGDNVSDSSRWVASAGATEHWLEVDLQQQYEISKIQFWTGEMGYNTPISDYQVQVWDPILMSWLTVASRTGNTDAAVVDTFAPVLTDRVRLLVDPGIDVKLYEFEVYS